MYDSDSYPLSTANEYAPTAATDTQARAERTPIAQADTPSGRLRHGTMIYHFQLVYTMGPMIYTIWYIPYGIYLDI